MLSVSAIGNGGYDRTLIQHNLFDEIDTSGNGSIDRDEVETAVTRAGGTRAAADALYAKLDPRNTGRVIEQQFRQNLPPLPFSDGIGAQMMVFQANGWPGGSSSSQGAQTARNLFSQIDSAGRGAITRTDLATAVTAAGGTVAAADALYAKLDPGNAGSVSAQQFISLLSPARPHRHHHHGRAANGGGDSVQDALAALLEALCPSDDAGATASPSRFAQALFALIDTGGSGAITRSDLTTAVTAAGGTIPAAEALYARLDPANTGRASAQQLADVLQPPSWAGGSAQDALLALINSVTHSASGTSTSSASGERGANATTPVTAIPGQTAADALWALLNTTGSNGSATSRTGTSGTHTQDALLALLNGNHFSLFASGASDPLASLMGIGTGMGMSVGLSMGMGTGTSGSISDMSGTRGQNALLALLRATGTTSSNGGWSSLNASGLDLPSAIRLYRHNLNQQMFDAMFATQ